MPDIRDLQSVRGVGLSGVALMVMLLAGVACGGDEDKLPKGYVLHEVFETTRPGFEIAYKEDWQIEESIKVDGMVGDRFSESVTNGATIELLCDPDQAVTGTVPFSQYNVDQLESQGVEVTLEEPVEIVGTKGMIDAGLITYTTDGTDYARVMNTDLNCGWTMTLASPEGTRDQYLEVLKTMASTFKRY